MAARTVHLTNAWHASSGGTRTVYHALLSAANRERRRVAVIVPGPETSVRRVGRFGRLYSLAAPRSPVLDRRYRVILPHRFVLSRRSAIWRILAREKPDLVEVGDKYSLCYVAGLIKRRPGDRPTVVGFSHERMDDAMKAFAGAGAWRQAFAEWYVAHVYLRQFDAHLANSAYTAEELRRAAHRYGPSHPKLWRLRDRIFTLPLGVDLSRFGPSRRSPQARAEMLDLVSGADRAALALFAGRLSPEKRAQWLVPAVRHAVDRGVDVRLIVAGDGPLRGELAREASAALPGRVALLGHVDAIDRLATYLASADVFLHPNPHEPFGLGPLEAMASGTPVVLPRAGGVLSYATRGNAWLAEPSPAGLGEQLVEALTHRDEADARARAALKTAARHDWAQVAAGFFRMYDEIHAARLAREGRTAPAPDYSVTDTPLIVS